MEPVAEPEMVPIRGSLLGWSAKSEPHGVAMRKLEAWVEQPISGVKPPPPARTPQEKAVLARAEKMRTGAPIDALNLESCACPS